MRLIQKQHWQAGLALVFVLLAVYLLLYNGIRIINDGLYLFDSTESLVRRGDFSVNLTYDLRPLVDEAGVPVRDGVYEPLQSILSAPLFWIGQTIPGIGMMQTTWLFNVLVIPLTAWLLYVGGVYLGYAQDVSVIVALIFGLATFTLHYSTSYFREPLAGLFTLAAFWSALMVSRVQNPVIPLLWVLASLVALALTRFAGLVIVPGIVILLLPGVGAIGRFARTASGLVVIGLGIIAIIGGVLLMNTDIIPERFTVDGIMQILQATNWNYVVESVVGHQVSPARSLWLYAPVLVVAVWGMIWTRQWRFLTAMLVTILLMAISAGVIHRQVWWAGYAWGPRYLLPIVPAMMLGVLPVVRWLRTHPFGRWHVAFGVLIAISVIFQLVGVSVFIGDYYVALDDAGVNPTGAGLWSVQWSPPVQHLRLLDWGDLNIALVQNSFSNWLGLALAGMLTLLIGASVLLWRAMRDQSERSQPGMVWYGVLVVVLIVTVFALLRGVYNDPRYDTEDTERMALIDQLNTTIAPDDVVFVQDAINMLAFMNRLKTPALMMSLPLAPGEVHNPDVPPQVDSDDLVTAISRPTAQVIDYEITRHDSAWLVMPYGPFVTFARRPTERYMVENYFPVTTIEVSQRARTIQFVSASTESVWSSESRYEFGEVLGLEQIEIYDSMVYVPGEVVPVSLVWSAQSTMARDYTISVQIGDVQTAIPISQRDTLPQGGFGYTSRWENGERYVDRHGLTLPEATPPGEYCVNVIVYYWEDGVRLQAVDGAGDPVGDVVCVARIEVTG